MALRALLEIVVHLESFRNIDLFYQGLYYLKVNLYNKRGEEVSIFYIRFFSFISLFNVLLLILFNKNRYF